ncbi:unnamed protein product [Arctogadus glacialis]
MAESPLVAVMSHLMSFLEQYSHFQQLQQQVDQYRVQLKRHRVHHRRQMKVLRASYRERLNDKNSIICSLEEAVSQPHTLSPLTPSEGFGKREANHLRVITALELICLNQTDSWGCCSKSTHHFH